MGESGESPEAGIDPKNGKVRGKRGAVCTRIWLVILFLAMAACIIALAVVLANKGDGEIEQSTPEPPTDDEDEAPKSASGSYRFASVAADNAECSQIGTEIMARQGGNAVDAAIATLLCLGVYNSQSTGVGGGFLMTIYNSTTKSIMTLNSREVAPLAATEDMYVNTTGVSTYGGMAIAVPGEIAGYAEVHRQYGKLPWSALFGPTIRLCEEGYVVSQALKTAIDAREKEIREQQGLRELFVKPDGTVYNKGDMMKRPVYAQTLRRIATEGAETYYNGSLADDIVADIQDNGGNITHEDLRLYMPVWKEPVKATLSNGGYTLYGPPPPSSAAVLYHILNIMDGYDVSKSDRESLSGRVLLAHRLVESMKFGYGKRSYLGDDAFVNVTEWVRKLESDRFAEETRQKIDDDRVLDFEDYDSAFEIVNDGGTSHLSVYGQDGSAVSVTSTINFHFGSKIRGMRTGIIFNNEMDDFSTPGTVNGFGVAASPSNFIEPGKRPMSSMSPTIVLNDEQEIVAIVGASGGTRIITGTIEVLMNTLWLGYNVTEAVDEPRYHHQLLPDEILHEISWPLNIREELAKKGHNFKPRTGLFCTVQLIKNVCNVDSATEHDICIHAVSDVRKGGMPDGY